MPTHRVLAEIKSLIKRHKNPASHVTRGFFPIGPAHGTLSPLGRRVYPYIRVFNPLWTHHDIGHFPYPNAYIRVNTKADGNSQLSAIAITASELPRPIFLEIKKITRNRAALVGLIESFFDSERFPAQIYHDVKNSIRKYFAHPVIQAQLLNLNFVTKDILAILSHSEDSILLSDTYLLLQEQDGVTGLYTNLQIISLMLNIDIDVHYTDGNNHEVISFKSQEKNQNKIRLLWDPLTNHYQALLRFDHLDEKLREIEQNIAISVQCHL